MTPFKEAFGSYGPVETSTGKIVYAYSLTALQQSLVSVAIIFIGIGGALAGLIGNYLGRRGAIQIACALIAAGAGGMLGTAGNYFNYMACKCIQGVGLGVLLAAGPVWGVECLLPKTRGMLLSFFSYGLAIGNMMAGCVCLATSKYTSNLAWQTPIICHIPLAVIFGLTTLVFPESPRWFLLKGREADARRSFGAYYGKPADDPVVSRQVQEVLAHIEMEILTEKTSTFLEIFHGVNLRRTSAAIIVVLGIALTGSKFMTTYAAIFLSGVGIKDPFLTSVIIASCTCVGVLGAPFVTEYGGRRFALLTGYAGLGMFMLLIAAVGSGVGQTSPVAMRTLVVFLCLWNFTYGLTVSTSLSTMAPEQHSLRLRTYGQAFVTLIYEIFSFGLSFSVPYMINKDYGNLGLNVGYVFFGISAIIWLGCFFFVPETGRLSLEQIDDLYLSGKPAWKTSLKKNKKVAADAAKE
ncbi:hypothetical protein CLAIMM_12205 isoform 2 [Cladophialophora immunda]|nr:hypothetical protein CLAIMM_12205 isoform 1 [Cladophialophora immunda]OQV07839.1 hypothetical protein CLAIMM_12205 isoform 2 [Cladophialophora immunda]